MQLGVIHNLQVSEEETDLGVTIDSKLTFDAHISNKINKATQMTRIIRRTFQFIDINTFLPLWFDHILTMQILFGTETKKNTYRQ